MNYDESVFKEKANRRARKIWLIFAILLSANYGSDVANGIHAVPYYLTFLVLCWFPILIGENHTSGEGICHRALPVYFSHRIWYFLYLCHLYYKFSDCLYLYSSCDKSSGSL